MERRLLLSTVAVALALGSVTASAQTRRPSDQDRNAPQNTQAQPPQGQMRANPPSGAAQNAPMPRGQAQQGEAQQGQAQQGQALPNAQSQSPAPRAPSTTTGQAAPPQQNAPAANNQSQQPASGQAQTPPPQQGAAQQGQAQPGQAQPGMAQPSNTAGTANTGTGGANANTNTQQNATAAPRGNQQGVITLNEQQNTRVSVAIRQANVRPLTNVSFAIAVGTAIPADVQLNALPPVLVEILPEYHDYSFIVVEQEALIIDPNSRAIVAVVPFAAQQTTGANTAPPPAQTAAPPAPAEAAAPSPRERKKLDLTRDQREIQRRQAERHRKSEKDKHVIIEERRTTTGAGPREPRVGDRVPDSPVIEGRPVEVYRGEPPVREERHPSARDIPLIGPLFGPPHED